MCGATSSGFKPIGDASTPFTGNFDGNHHSIANLTIERPTGTNIGLFGMTGSTGVVRNLGLTDATVTGGTNTGVLVGSNGGNVSNSYANDSTLLGTTTTGTLAGFNSGSNPRNPPYGSAVWCSTPLQRITSNCSGLKQGRNKFICTN